jgi:hypothetical protein
MAYITMQEAVRAFTRVCREDEPTATARLKEAIENGARATGALGGRVRPLYDQERRHDLDIHNGRLVPRRDGDDVITDVLVDADDLFEDWIAVRALLERETDSESEPARGRGGRRKSTIGTKLDGARAHSGRKTEILESRKTRRTSGDRTQTSPGAS